MLYRNRTKFIWIRLGSVLQIVCASRRNTYNPIPIINQGTAAHAFRNACCWRYVSNSLSNFHGGDGAPAFVYRVAKSMIRITADHHLRIVGR